MNAREELMAIVELTVQGSAYSDATSKYLPELALEVVTALEEHAVGKWKEIKCVEGMIEEWLAEVD